MPFFMIRFLHVSAVHTGLTVLAYPLAMGLTAPFGGLLADRWSARHTALTGTALVAAGDLFLAQASQTADPAGLAWRLALTGLGMGLFSGPNQSTIMGLAPRESLATAGAATALSRSLGFAPRPSPAHPDLGHRQLRRHRPATGPAVPVRGSDHRRHHARHHQAHLPPASPRYERADLKSGPGPIRHNPD